MFTVEQIKAAHAKVKSGADFPAYIKEIKGLGLIRYEFMVADGTIDYYGAGNYKVSAPAIYPARPISNNAQPMLLKKNIEEHQQGQSDFLTFCQLAADAGVQKWVVDTQTMLCIYYNLDGNEMIAEPIPQ
ncbi:DUF1398 domain-containing protein [Mucilaginibacter auburnensis]|uniref:Uncharacterized protein YbcV (DUF1398 family) n=1 Tax=Mucilaginibacter auburnensis TaxID=1457233 RepID=A0A2H9VTY8_9SPHI|nr:DUF1398 family protein [Mucilaginibacter auburnensis]PJJ84290.1 uncharacterized protein YbcV (DUF1398 family) [Mucilaginibacter auburnensis]